MKNKIIKLLLYEHIVILFIGVLRHMNNISVI